RHRDDFNARQVARSPRPAEGTGAVCECAPNSPSNLPENVTPLARRSSAPVETSAEFFCRRGAVDAAFSSSFSLQRWSVRHRSFRGLRPSLRLEAKGLDQLLHVLDLVSHKPAHLLGRAAGDNVAVFGQLRDQLWSMSRLHEFSI